MMHYYQFNVGDYIKNTIHLLPLEDLAYRRLLDFYYDSEKPIPNDIPWVSRRLRLDTDVVQNVLNEFFELTADGYKNHRADLEIGSYHEYMAKQKANGSKGGRPKKTQTKPTANPNQTQNNLKQETTNINHKTINKSQRGTRLAQDWVLTKSLGEWAQTERPDLNIRQVAEQFKDYWIAQAGQKGVKLDWAATWRNWVRNSKATKPNPYDIVRLTKPASNEPDAALAKIKADEKTTRPPTQAEREMLASLKRKS
jgi:uncharacterized protein YdaU (DUF1376 family)